MELIELPKAMRNRGFTGWPQVYRVGKNEEPPPPGVSYILAEKVDFALVFRLMVPILMKQHGYFDWPTIYRSITGRTYQPPRVYQTYDMSEPGDQAGRHYGAASYGKCDVSLEDLAADDATYVDLDMLTELRMIPAFMSDIREAVKVNVTNSFAWQDGFNKKTGVCSGYLVEQPRPRSLIILDISSSIPDGVSAGMLTLIKTMSDIVHADVILTASHSKFFTVDEVRHMDIHAERHNMGRGNERESFVRILESHDMDYETVISFGDSDAPGPIELEQTITTKRWYSFFCMKRDRYGSGYEQGAGYGQWVLENNPHVQVTHHTDWAKFFNHTAPSGTW